jgi:hypothetical protein
MGFEELSALDRRQRTDAGRAMGNVLVELEAFEQDRLADDALASSEDGEHFLGQAQRKLRLPDCQVVNLHQVRKGGGKHEPAQNRLSRHDRR